MKVALSTDTSCSISKEIAQKYNINVFPLNVIVDGNEYLDGVTINQDELMVAMRDNKNIKTSTPPPGDIINYFTELFNQGYDYVVHFTISSKLSSMNNLFNNVSQDYFENKVIVIDSYSLSTVMLSHVFYAYELINKGVEPEQIRNIMNERILDGKIVFVPENLKALKNGGRISPVIAAMLGIAGLKPVLSLIDGKLEKEALAKNIKKLFHEKITDLATTHPIDKYDYVIAVFDTDPALVEFVNKELLLAFPDYKAPVFPIAINVCAHCGPGTLGLIVSPKFDGHSLVEYL